MHRACAIHAESIALAVFVYVELSRMASGTGEIQNIFAKSGFVTRRKSYRQMAGVKRLRGRIYQESIRAHALRIGKLGRSPRYFKVHKSRVANVFQPGTLRREIEKLAQRFVLPARPAPALADIDML